NSPAEFTRDRCAGRTLLFSTTNGAVALEAALRAGARTVRIACLWNAAAAAEASVRDGADEIGLLCAGTDGRFTIEDAIGAGVVAERIAGLAPGSCDLDDSARAAIALRRSAGDDLVRALRDSHGGRNLEALGASADVRLCAQVDRSRAVPI